MKAQIGYGWISLVLVAACGSKAEWGLFSTETSATNEPAGGAAGSVSTGGSSVEGNQAPSVGGANAGGSVAGGAEPSAGGSASGGRAGSPAALGGSAGSEGGTGGTPTPPVCGNGKLEEDEECDDAGHEGEDGCRANCQVVCSDFGADAVKSDAHHCYNGFDSADFAGAREDCVERGGHLATVSSSAENTIAASLVQNSKWIGALEDVGLMQSGSGQYQWISGEPFVFTNWGEAEPSRTDAPCNPYTRNPRCYEHCVVIREDGTWDDRRCDTEDGYICEWEPAGL